MDIIYKTGDLTKASEYYIAHGCNAQGKMGSGVAKALMDQYPSVRKTYIVEHRRTLQEHEPFLGTVHIGYSGEDHMIFNTITQESYGYDGKLYASYVAIEQSIVTLDLMMHVASRAAGKMQHIAFPLLGCGLAGGDWAIVSKILTNHSKHFQPVVYTLDGVIPSI